ncbi:MAG: hypothetical protein A3I44_05180 [Candidatus Sungbacteria bacterium RIFCSPLOWO2_02_FULL_51_17]|uniref:ASCH domain-containing protein n=1 Tax=Candidatus Sungbacteria bacterium RIFCSPHIGHO2_02_FULL_51_29 TaxID=1802273 RepID=A0A1G2KP21_9BACT|nr:MAG: hypothetical protein A2676_00615 [Candidatus Sungbacteria bacterium RIFCSPHIGHO2_01_FULL_51_22]OHA01160.1 MAG: hypothetical protein A3C16_04550 [Candidatus Sungbacteria bacterium RIFCSPHIGHO2_02_FULL_51_29]OHA08056.1 MAG: hypothetical protein A3B29_03860 [Candidatus Sungbacteria bacterium RIFCSPLOWO2_01_FULL_51_34]OHA11464.1 MAG: hypothetical protein A3I44_05180 [Candidatus Sungbacteria bacterium RIFCSPLOWO2_02_FULL_51_17]
MFYVADSVMKTLKFIANLIPPILSRKKTSTWRLFDDKDLRVGDTLCFVEHETGREFATAKVISVREKPLGEINEQDAIGQEKFDSREKMLEAFRSHYGNAVTMGTIVKMVDFVLVSKEKQVA